LRQVRGSRIRRGIALAACLSLAAAPVTAAVRPGDAAARVAQVLKRVPLVDGHNDLAEVLRERLGDEAENVDLERNVRAETPVRRTDLPRLRAGKVGGQFWSVWVPPDLAPADAVRATLIQIDLVKQLCRRYPRDFELSSTAADVWRIHKDGRIACLIGVEGGHQIGGSLAVLRQYQELGARYLTLTHALTTEWADSATDVPRHGGLTDFGRKVIQELNRLGMLVDLSHVSPDVMRQALELSQAPVIFSHSSARALVDYPRNVPDDILRLVARNGGVVMVNFYAGFVSADHMRWSADREAERARLSSSDGIYVGQPQRAAAAMAEWDRLHPKPIATLAQVANHIEHIRDVAGADHVGLGADFDGASNMPAGLEAVDTYPALLEELVRRGWSDEDLGKLAGGNVLRVLAQAESVANRIHEGLPPLHGDGLRHH